MCSDTRNKRVDEIQEKDDVERRMEKDEGVKVETWKSHEGATV